MTRLIRMNCPTRRETPMRNAKPFRPPVARILLPDIALATGPAAWAHSGHGLGDGTHWHATDAWGWALGLAVVAATLWLSRRK